MLLSLITAVGGFDYSLLLNPAHWWETSEVDWDRKLKLEVYVTLVTAASFALDLLFSSEQKQGNSILLVPTILYSIVYFIISIHAQFAGLLDPAVYKTFNTTKIGVEMFSQPEIMVFAFTHLFALDLFVAFAMMKDFYTRITSRRMGSRLIMVLIVGITPLQGISTIPIYAVLRSTLFAGSNIQTPRPLPTNRNCYKRERDALLDPVPKGAGAINGWVQKKN